MKNIKKHIVAIAVFVFVMFTFLGCNTVDGANDMFTKVCSKKNFVHGDIYVYRENTTDVMYMIYSSGYKGGLTVMLDADGSPLLYSEWKDRTE